MVILMIMATDLYEGVTKIMFENNVTCQMSLMRNWSSGFPIRSHTNQAVQPQKMSRGLKFRFWKEEGLFYLCCENKGAEQLHGYWEADLRLCFHICKMPVFS